MPTRTLECTRHSTRRTGPLPYYGTIGRRVYISITLIVFEIQCDYIFFLYDSKPLRNWKSDGKEECLSNQSVVLNSPGSPPVTPLCLEPISDSSLPAAYSESRQLLSPPPPPPRTSSSSFYYQHLSSRSGTATPSKEKIASFPSMRSLASPSIQMFS